MSEIVHRFKASPGSMGGYKRVRPIEEFMAAPRDYDYHQPMVVERENEVTQAFLSVLLDPYTNPWHCYVEVVENYMPPYPRPETKPTIQVRWGNHFLRFGRRGLAYGFWDIYGEPFQTVQEAWVAVSMAPAPPFFTYRNRGVPPEDDK